ncbi:response regulator transcription factor [Stieleria varia]|uniref:Response regulator protein TodT n=1 Tax=Stieleria varia TaxID=2528005 RepID=A0A5C6A1Z0_9BACT|nr:response regulator [Stieleria varia]TWT93307.1 Response regulator protein TodT [Stieleria varia]
MDSDEKLSADIAITHLQSHSPKPNEPLPSTVVYLVDNDSFVLQSVQRVLAEIGINAKAFHCADEMLANSDLKAAGCVITDLRMPGLSGAELHQALLDRDSTLSVIVLTAHADIATTVKLMKNGAAAVIEKPFRADTLRDEVLAAIASSQKGYARRKRQLDAKERISRLSSEEIAVMESACRGIPNRQISVELSLSNRTIDRRRQSAMRKLQVDSVADFAVLRATAENG